MAVLLAASQVCRDVPLPSASCGVYSVLYPPACTREKGSNAFCSPLAQLLCHCRCCAACY